VLWRSASARAARRIERFVAEVRRGHVLTITDHGRPVARLVPIEQPPQLERLPAEGLQPARRPESPAPEPVEASGTVSDLVDDQRR
jgi:prevent-host-death family protein